MPATESESPLADLLGEVKERLLAAIVSLDQLRLRLVGQGAQVGGAELVAPSMTPVDVEGAAPAGPGPAQESPAPDQPQGRPGKRIPVVPLRALRVVEPAVQQAGAQPVSGAGDREDPERWSGAAANHPEAQAAFAAGAGVADAADQGRLQQALAALKQDWEGAAPLPVLDRYGVDLDLRTAQGRWELLALATLYGAPVRPQDAEQAFLEMREQELLDLRRFRRGRGGSGSGVSANSAGSAGGDAAARNGRAGALEAIAGDPALSELRDRLQQVLDRHYRGPVNRSRQAAWIVANGRLLHERWGGDLTRLYREAGGDGETILEGLGEFWGLGRRRAWICREMKRHGLWPEVEDWACLFVDSSVRKAVDKLAPGRARTEGDYRAFVEEYLEGDCVPLFNQGRERCGKESLSVCMTRCPLLQWCPSWR